MEDANDKSSTGERIAKRLARAGVCSRREAERLIAEGRVKVDGDTLQTPAVLVTEASRIVVDGRAIGVPAPTALWRYHKPSGVLATHRDPQSRPTVFDRLPKEHGRLIAVGRLDFNSEGLLLLTNDGELARRLELPSTGWTRRYRARVYGRPDAQRLAGLSKGVTVEGVRYGPIEARLESQKGANAWLVLALKEGKNREVRRVLQHLGLEVNRLIRVAFGPFQLGTLKRDELSRIPAKVVHEQLGAPPTGDAPREKARRSAHRRR